MLQHKKGLQETEIEIKYPEMTERIAQMIRHIRQYDSTIEGFKEDQEYKISLEQVYYIETTDRKTFIYLKNDVYESRKTIQTIESTLEGTTIVRIGKALLLNISALKSLRPYPNHRIMGELLNGENLLVSRRYIEILKERMSREYGV